METARENNELILKTDQAWRYLSQPTRKWRVLFIIPSPSILRTRAVPARPRLRPAPQGTPVGTPSVTDPVGALEVWHVSGRFGSSIWICGPVTVLSSPVLSDSPLPFDGKTTL